jgi:SCP-2 sterol transfer family
VVSDRTRLNQANDFGRWTPRLTSWATRAAASDCVAEIFEQIAGGSRAPSTGHTKGIVEFDLGEAGQWFLDLQRDPPAVSRMASHADCRIICRPRAFIAVAQGRANLLTAYLRGDVNFVGDVSVAMSLRHMVPLTGES